MGFMLHLDKEKAEVCGGRKLQSEDEKCRSNLRHAADGDNFK